MNARWICLLALGLICLSVIPIEAEDEGNANQFVDFYLQKLLKNPFICMHLDPLRIPDIVQNEYKLRNMLIKGLLNLYRHGNCTLSLKGATVNMVIQVAVDEAYVSLDYVKEGWFALIDGQGEVKIDHLAIEIDSSFTDGKAYLNSIKVTELHYQVTKTTGVGIVNGLLKIVTNDIAQKYKEEIISTIENEAGKSIDNLLEEIKLPF